MTIDIKNLKDANLEDLQRESTSIARQLTAGRDILKAVNDEITLRENLDHRVKGIENLSDVELDRALEERAARRAKAQSVSGAGDVPSQEAVVGTAVS